VEVPLLEQERAQVVVEVGLALSLVSACRYSSAARVEIAPLLIEQGEVRVGAHEEGIRVDRLAVVRLGFGASPRLFMTLPRLLNPSA
jgi:hypothetical protein